MKMSFELVHRQDSDRYLKEAEVLLYFLSSEERSASLNQGDAWAQQLQQLKERNIFQAKAGQVYLHRTYQANLPPFVLLIGVGEKPDIQTYKRAAAEAARDMIHYRFSQAVVLFSLEQQVNLTLEDVISAITEGIILGGYQQPTYASLSCATKAATPCQQLVFISENRLHDSVQAQIQQTLIRTQIIAAATNEARDWINTPGNMLTPQTFAQKARNIAETYELTCEMIQAQQLVNQHLQGLYHVGKGSEHEPLCVVLRYRGCPESSEILGLVGKGITFDSGGISLKHADGMEELIDDMGGAAAVLAVMKIVGQLKPKVNIEAVIPCAENMPSGSAYKPGDVIPTLSGKTIEVVNTDAEGRIVLADGVALAQQRGATKIIDVATLTGAVMVALGTVATGAVTNDEAFFQEFLLASEKAGEKIWQLPVYEEYKAMLQSDVADVKNSCGKEAAAITAGLFIGTFVAQVPWIHLDIGGTVRLKHPRGVDPKGGTGVMVRSLATYILDLDHSQTNA